MALLACNGHISIERAADVMGVLLDAPVSTGFAGGLIRRVADRLVDFEQTLKDRLRVAPVMHHDETPARVDGDDADRLLYIGHRCVATATAASVPTSVVELPTSRWWRRQGPVSQP